MLVLFRGTYNFFHTFEAGELGSYFVFRIVALVGIDSGRIGGRVRNNIHANLRRQCSNGVVGRIRSVVSFFNRRWVGLSVWLARRNNAVKNYKATIVL